MDSKERLDKIGQKAYGAALASKTLNVLAAISLLAALFAPLMFIATAIFVALKVIILYTMATPIEEIVGKDLLVLDISDKMFKTLMSIVESNQIWEETEREVVSPKYNGGACFSTHRIQCKGTNTVQFPFKSDCPTACFKSKNVTLAFVPGSLIVSRGRTLYLWPLESVTIGIRPTRFVEDRSVPKDTRTVGSTWQYVNKSGGPDRRYKTNRQIPICLYGELSIKIPDGSYIKLIFSKSELVESK